jgi:tRNA pseudouridine38-40 synthase
VRVRLDLGYDGTGFSGWAVQPGLRTVAGVLSAALATVLRVPGAELGLVVAGRTDAGVHARGQVCHLDVPEPAWAGLAGEGPEGPGGRLLRRLRGVLPEDVRVHAVARAPEGFDARFAALRRRYSYRVCDDPAGVPPLRRREVLTHRRTLDVTAMATASAQLLGLHDFAAFCRRREGATTVRTLLAYHWEREADGLLVARVEADAFCHSMVRALVGAAIAVGDGRRPSEWPAQVLAARRRDPAVTVVAPLGLVLEEVIYPVDERLSARVVEARARRDGSDSHDFPGKSDSHDFPGKPEPDTF